MSKFVLNEPKGQHVFKIYTTLSSVRVASYTSHTLPCLNIKHIAVKIISKVQQTLNALVNFTQRNCYALAPNIAVPTRTMVEPDMIACFISPDIPIDKVSI